MVIAGKDSKENLQEVANILKTTNNPQVYIYRSLKSIDWIYIEGDEKMGKRE
jgi:hypothetical protein